MIEKESIIKLLNKYGFTSLIKEPFLYENNEEIGIYYSFKDPLYGYLNRVFLPTTIKEADEFLKMYYLYKKKNKKGTIKITLPYYNNAFVKPLFEQTTIEEPEKQESSQKNINKKAARTALLLIEIISEKIYMQKCTYNSVQKIIYNYHIVKNKFLEKENTFLNKKNEIIPPEPVKEMDENVIEFTTILKQELESISDNDTLTSFILSLTDYLKELEKDEALLKNKYYLIKTPIETNIFQKKIQVIEKLEEKRKSRAKKVNIDQEWEAIETQSEINKIVSLTSFVNNEKKRIDEKYEMINEMDITTIADYLIEFDNLNIEEPRIQTEEKEDKGKEKTYEQTMISLEEQFKTRSKEEQNNLYIVTSYLRKIITQSYQHPQNEKKFYEQVNEALKTLNNPINLLAKIKIFKTVDLTNPEKFIASLKEKITNVFQQNPFQLQSDINVFLKSNHIPLEPYIVASTKKNCMPIINDSLNPITYIITIKKDSIIYFSPQELTIDIHADDQLLLKENHPLLIIDTKKNDIYKENSDIIKVSQFTVSKKIVNSFVTICEIKELQTSDYQKIEIKRKEERKNE